MRLDPELAKAHQAREDYLAQVQVLRGDVRLTELAKAEQIEAAWLGYRTTVAEASQVFWTRRQERLQALEAALPIGPNVPDDTPRADAAVLHQAFAAAYQQALDAPMEQLPQRYTQARRFGDDLTARAVLTASVDRGSRAVVEAWTAEAPEREVAMAEAMELRSLIHGGVTTDALFVSQAFGASELDNKPSEVWQLPRLREAAGVTR
ncbi:hypothetical protein [Nocardioides humi]|uniref:hypothetical protein n=1 Tax=Nocardioides humi TaxID=449461 RepID=UPI001126878B|nr:hypothetical protein [Nocardioides humi]